MNQALHPTPKQYLELHDMAMDTLWQAELAGASFLSANLQDDELKAAIRTMLTILRASKLYDIENIGELRHAIKRDCEVAA